MVKQKKVKQAQEKLRLTGRFGEKIAKEIVARRKVQITKFERVTKGLSNAEVDELQKRSPSSRIGRKLLKERAGKRIEDNKKTFFCKGNKCSDDISKLLVLLSQRHGALSKSELRRNKKDLHPFEDEPYVTSVLNKNDTQIMVMGSSSKKRPRRLVFSRTYNRIVLDMIEFTLSDLSVKPGHFENGMKPLVLTMGSLWEGRYEMACIRNMLVDFFHGCDPEKIFATSVDRLIVLIAIPSNKLGEVDPLPQVMVKEYKIILENSGSASPFVNLSDAGFSFVLSMDRLKSADADLFEKTLRVPREQFTETTRAIEGKGVTRNEFGDVLKKIFFKNETEKLAKLFTPATRILKRTIPEGKLRTPDKKEDHKAGYDDFTN